jgi:hypothetical protein
MYEYAVRRLALRVLVRYITYVVAFFSNFTDLIPILILVAPFSTKLDAWNPFMLRSTRRSCQGQTTFHVKTLLSKQKVAHKG